jgi:hypothetical protein
MTTDISKVMESVRNSRQAFEYAATRDLVEKDIDNKMLAERENLTRDGVFVGSEENLGKYRQRLEANASVTALKAGTQFEIDHGAAGKTLAAVRASHETLKLPAQAYMGHDDVARAVLRATTATEQVAIYQSATGRDLATQADRYERADDAQDVVFVSLFEQGLAEGFRSWPIVANPDRDVITLQRIRSLVSARRAARVPQDIREAEQELAQMMTATLDAQLRLVKRGHLAIASSR